MPVKKENVAIPTAGAIPADTVREVVEGMGVQVGTLSPAVVNPVEVELSEVIEPAELAPDVEIEIEPEGTGTLFDFRIEPELMDPSTRQIFYMLRYVAYANNDMSAMPNGKQFRESFIAEKLGPSRMMAAGLAVDPSIPEPDVKKIVVDDGQKF